MRVITFGEIMLRLSPAGNYRFLQAESFGATFGGGEANVLRAAVKGWEYIFLKRALLSARLR